MFGPFLPLGHSLICLQKWLATRSSGASERVFGWKTCTLVEYMLTQQQHLISQQGSVLHSSPTLAESQVRLGELFGVSFSFSLQVGTLELCLNLLLSEHTFVENKLFWIQSTRVCILVQSSFNYCSNIICMPKTVPMLLKYFNNKKYAQLKVQQNGQLNQQEESPFQSFDT